MSQEKIDQLTAEELELQNKLAELRERKRLLEEEKRKILEASKPVTVTVLKYDDATEVVSFRNTFRDDLITYFRQIPSREYDGRTNNMSRDAFLTFYGDCLTDEIKNVSFEFAQSEFDKYDMFARILHRIKIPHYTVSVSDKQYRVDLANNAPANPMQGIPGARWHYEKQHYLIPLSEGWRLYANLTTEGIKAKYIVQWTDDALQSAIEQAEKRNMLATLATAEDVELDSHFIDGLDLRAFQRVGVAFGEAANGRWICGDQPGLGKTWQGVSFAWRKHLEAKERGINYTTVVVCPANLKINWIRMIKMLTGTQAYLLTGTKPAAIDLAHMLKGTSPFFVLNYDILSTKNTHRIKTKDERTGYDVFQDIEQWPWVEAIKLCNINFVIFDEAHYGKNIDSKRSQAMRLLVDVEHQMLATGTPLVNRVDELFPLLHQIDPHTFSSETRFVSQYAGADGRTARNIEELREILKFIMIRRLTKDVIKDLPPINDIVHWHELSVRAKKVYNKVLMGLYEVMSEWNPNEAGHEKKITHILAQIIRLKQVCAIDKAEMVADLAVELYDSAVPEEPNKKVIIFSQFKPVAWAIAKRLGHEALVFTGEDNESERMKMVDRFQTDDNVHFLVMTSKVASEGLTLTRASHVVFADLMWTPKDHQQCIGRAYGRINDLHGANVHWCVADETIENWIQGILAGKTALIGQVVDGREITGDESVAPELMKHMREEMFKRKNAK